MTLQHCGKWWWSYCGECGLKLAGSKRLVNVLEAPVRCICQMAARS